MLAATIPAPSEERTGDFVPGTIGFDLYLAALRIDRAALKPARNFPSSEGHPNERS